jgi:hypothetical protein
MNQNIMDLEFDEDKWNSFIIEVDSYENLSTYH